MSPLGPALWKRIALLSGTLVVCMVLAEIGLRVVSPVRTFVNPMTSFHRPDPEVGWLGLPDLDARFHQIDFDVRVRHGAGGFRLREGPVVPSPQSPVIAFFGDSFTWGWGVTGGRQFTDVVQERLGPGFDVRNFGVNNYSTIQEWLLLRREMSNGLHPRLVVVMLFNNDYQENLDLDARRPHVVLDDSEAPPRFAPATEPAVKAWRIRAKKSALFSTVAYVFDLQKNKRRSRRLAESTYVEGRLSGDSRRAMSWALARIREACASEGARLACVYVASFEDVRADQDGGARTTSRDLCAELGIPFLDLTPGLRLRGGSATGRFYFEHDMHWSDEGNAVVGEELAVFLRGLLSPPNPAR
jgi:GDSL-like Lipase/Acylhydrolase family